MSRVPSRRSLLQAFLALPLAASGCKIVRDADKASVDPSDPNNFDAKSYVGAMWDRKVLRFFDERAYPVAQVLAALARDKDAAGARFGHRAGGEGGPWTFAVRGTGVVTALNTASRHGELALRVPSGARAVDATLQIGPVVFGTAVRDSLPFIAFGDFVNQIQYAEVSRALNDRAVSLTHGGLVPPPRVGSSVAFVGAMIDPSMTGDTTITPVRVRAGHVSPR